MKLETVLASLGDYTEDCILITDAEPLTGDGPRILWCNPSFTRMTGYTLEEIVGKTPRILQGPETSEDSRRDIREQLHRWSPVHVELLNYTKAGRPFWVDLRIMPVADETGWFHYWVSVQRDVTLRKEAELSLAARNVALERAQQRLQREREEIAGIAAVAEHAQDLITITDLEFRILWANPAFVAKTGFAVSDIVGLYHCDVTRKHSDRYPSRLVAVKAIINGTFVADEVCNYSRTGEEYWTDLQASVQRDAMGRAVRLVIVERDITEKRLLRRELESHRDHLQSLVDERTATIRHQAEDLESALEAEKALSRLQREFVSMVSHELRTPLAVIDGRTHLLEKRVDRLDPEFLDKTCKAIHGAIWRLTELMESVLQSARLEQGDIAFNPAPSDLGAIIAEALAASAEVFPRHEATAEVEGDLSAVWCDPTLMRQCIWNLLSNAGKYSDPGSRIRVRARHDAATRSVCVSVSDTGVGIPPDELERLFTRFFRASTSVGRPGTGIGLHLVQHFVQMHGGFVTVESDVGAGSTFTITIPARAAKAVA